MGQRGVFEVGVDLLDDRVPAVGFVGGDSVEFGGGEEGVEAPGVEQGGLPIAGPVRELNAVKSISATSAREIHRPVFSS